MCVLVCAYLAAVFLCGDARREGHEDLAEQFRTRALGTAAVTGVVGLGGIFVLRSDAPLLFAGLTSRGLPVVALSAVASLAAIWLLVKRQYVRARISSAVAVTAILIGWAVGQYLYVLPPALTIEEAARGCATLTAMLVVLVIGSFILVPALVYMYALFQRGHPDMAHAASEGVSTHRGGY